MKNQFNKFLQLSGLGIQMGLTIYLFSWGGEKLNEYLNFEGNKVKLVMIMLGVVVSMLSLIYQLKRINGDGKK